MSKDEKKVICTFGNYPLSKGFDRYRKDGQKMNTFDEVYTYDEKELDKEFKRKFGRYMYPYSRGYGYWCWKPYIIRKTLDKMEEGDILLYTDLGCFLNIDGRTRLLEYFEMVRTSESGILGTRSQEKSYNGRPETIRYDYQWTKGDVFDYFGVRNDKSYTHTTQFESGIIFIRKSAVSIAFIDEWLEAIYKDFSLITDSPSRSPNLEGFIENRHDQSIYSILAKKYRIGEFSTNETCTSTREESWDELKEYPIHARREVYYKSRRHYIHRNKLRKLYDAWWRIKYFFIDLFN